MVPDFTLEKKGRKIFVEIVGFWTEEYLKRKLEKLRLFPEEFILLVNKNLRCSPGFIKNARVIFYKIKFALKRYSEFSIRLTPWN